MVGFEFVVVGVGVCLAFDRAGAGVTSHTSLVQLRRSGVVVVSEAAGVAVLVGAGMVVVVVDEVGVAVLAGSCEASASRITNAARKFAMAFWIWSGNGPDLFIFYSNSIWRSLMLHCATVLSDIVCCLCR
jgi:hypothetical protein